MYGANVCSFPRYVLFCSLFLFVCLFVCFLSICEVYFCIYTELPFFPVFSFVLGLSITLLKIYDTIYWVKEWKNEWLGEWFNGRMNEWMNEWIDRTQFILNTGCISWRIISSSSSYNSSSKRCNLCLKEKFLIICRPDLSSLNKRNELVSSCRHRNKALLRNN